jgi:hypothetical protein
MPHSANPTRLDPVAAFLHRVVPYGGIDTSPAVHGLLSRAAAKSSGRNQFRPDRTAAAQASLLPDSPKQDQKD